MSELANLLQVWTTDPRTASLTISMMYFPYDSFLAIHLLEFETVVVVSDLTKGCDEVYDFLGTRCSTGLDLEIT